MSAFPIASGKLDNSSEESQQEILRTPKAKYFELPVEMPTTILRASQAQDTQPGDFNL
jgi:hypothetical protein